MKDSTRNKVEGKVLEMKGVVKKKTGEITNDLALTAEGVADQAVGKAQQGLGKLEAKLDAKLEAHRDK